MKETNMNLDVLDDEEVLLTSRALSIHRVSMRRKLNRLNKGSAEHQATLAEIESTQRIVAKLNRADLKRISA